MHRLYISSMGQGIAAKVFKESEGEAGEGPVV